MTFQERGGGGAHAEGGRGAQPGTNGQLRVDGDLGAVREREERKRERERERERESESE